MSLRDCWRGQPSGYRKSNGSEEWSPWEDDVDKWVIEDGWATENTRVRHTNDNAGRTGASNFTSVVSQHGLSNMLQPIVGVHRTNVAIVTLDVIVLSGSKRCA